MENAPGTCRAMNLCCDFCGPALPRDVITAPEGTNSEGAFSVIKERKLGRLPIVNGKGELV